MAALHPLIRAAHDLAASGRIGEVVGVRADLSRRFEFDPAGRLFDLRPAAARCSTWASTRRRSPGSSWAGPTAVATTGSLSPTGSDVTVGDAVGLCRRPGRPDLLPAPPAQPLRGARSPAPPAGSGSSRIHRPTALTVHTDAGEEIVTADDGPRATATAWRSPRSSAACRRGRAGEPAGPARRHGRHPRDARRGPSPTRRALPRRRGLRTPRCTSPTEASRSSSSAGARSRCRWRGSPTGCRRSSTCNPEFEMAVDRLATWLARADDED